MAILYTYHPQTGRAGASQPADTDLLTGEAVLLTFTTFAAPPVCGMHEAAVFLDACDRVPLDPTTGAWRIVADWVGHRYWLADGSVHEISELGITPPAGALSDPPSPSLDVLRAVALAKLPIWENGERAAGVEHAGRRWLTTQAALQDIRDCLLAGVVPGGVWVDADRQTVPMALAGLQSLWQAIVTRGAQIYQRRIEMETAVATMTAENLQAFEPGWPS